MAKSEKKPEGDFDLDAIIDEADKQHSLTPRNLERGTLVADAISTGSLALDLITGGGWPICRRANVFGHEQVGKSTALYYAVKACIEQGIRTIFYDFEGATDGDRVERIGIKLNWLKEMEAKEPVLFRYYDTMKSGEEMYNHALSILLKMPDAMDGPCRIAFFHDSLPATTPIVKLENPDSNANAMVARMYSDNLKRIKQPIAAKRGIWIDTNQLRLKPQVMYGNPEYEPCGEAVRTLSDVRIKAKKTIPTTNRGVTVGKGYIEEEPCWNYRGMDCYNYSIFFVVKNKGFSPNRGCTLRLWFEEAGQPGRGFDPLYDVYEYLRLTGQIKYHKRRLTILNLEPFAAPREVFVQDTDKSGKLLFDDNGQPIYKRTNEPEVDAEGKPKKDADGNVIMKYEKDSRSDWTWMELKDLILNPANTKGRERKQWDLVTACRRQIKDGSAFKLYFDNIVTTTSVEKETEKENDDG